MFNTLASYSLVSQGFVILGVVLMAVHLGGLATALNQEKPSRILLVVWIFGLLCSALLAVVGILMFIRQLDLWLME